MEGRGEVYLRHNEGIKIILNFFALFSDEEKKMKVENVAGKAQVTCESLCLLIRENQ